jgi:hypothetical protein
LYQDEYWIPACHPLAQVCVGLPGSFFLAHPVGCATMLMDVTAEIRMSLQGKNLTVHSEASDAVCRAVSQCVHQCRSVGGTQNASSSMNPATAPGSDRKFFSSPAWLILQRKGGSQFGLPPRKHLSLLGQDHSVNDVNNAVAARNIGFNDLGVVHHDLPILDLDFHLRTLNCLGA